MLEFYADELIIGETYYQEPEKINLFRLEVVIEEIRRNLMSPVRVEDIESYFFDEEFPNLVPFGRNPTYIWYK